MDILVNGKAMTYKENSKDLLSIVKDLGFDLKYVAIAVNQSLIPKERYSATQIKSGDQIEILSPTAGG